MSEATAATAPILDVARVLLSASGDVIAEKQLTLIGLSVTSLSNADAVQLRLPLGARNRPAVDTTLDEISAKFPDATIARASSLHGSPHVAVPLLAD